MLQNPHITKHTHTSTCHDGKRNSFPNAVFEKAQYDGKN